MLHGRSLAENNSVERLLCVHIIVERICTEDVNKRRLDQQQLTESVDLACPCSITNLM